MAMFLTTVMSLGLRVLRLLMADWRAGIASARSFSQSSLEMFDVVIVVEIARSFVTTTRMKTRSRVRMCRRRQHHIENVDGTNGSDKADDNRYMIYNIDGDLIA